MEVGVTEQRTTADDPSFDEWVDARVAALLRFAYLVTGSQHAAEDAVQSALVRACEKWSRVRRATDPDAYVRRMVVNAHVSAWRRSGRRELTVAEVRDTEVGDHAEPIVTGDAVWRVCATLPPQQRAAVVLRYYEDLEYAEIAVILGTAQATARSHVHRALAAMRAELQKEDGDD
jgi:RNA polymerase sigma-70 factor (sigma-E family)